jgi:hypothetical protein
MDAAIREANMPDPDAEKHLPYVAHLEAENDHLRRCIAHLQGTLPDDAFPDTLPMARKIIAGYEREMDRMAGVIKGLEAERDQWKSCVPSHCPITGLPHHGNFKDPDTGEYRAFYGGPIISYGLPYKDSDNYLSRERLDEDDMSSEHETMCLLVVEEEEMGAIQERITNMEAVRAAAEALKDTVDRCDEHWICDSISEASSALGQALRDAGEEP